MNAGRRGLTNAGEDEVTAIKESHELIEKSICQIRICVTRTTMVLSSFTNGSYYEHCECTRSVTGITNQGTWKRIALPLNKLLNVNENTAPCLMKNIILHNF
jgi:hypothetical protein